MSKHYAPIPKSAYQIAWERIRDAPAGKETIIQCELSARETLIQAIARTKSAENVARKAMDLPHFGPTKVVRYIRQPGETLCKVGFTLMFNMEQML
jgi:hypothetical protein